MKYILSFITIIFLHLPGFGQKLDSGTYIFKYCDLEYNKCLSTCKVLIRKASITICTTKELAKAITLTKEGDIINHGIILKHKSGKWIIGKSKKDMIAKEIGFEGPAIIDFKKRQYWTF